MKNLIAIMMVGVAGIACGGSLVARGDDIPYPKALKDASIKVEKLDSIFNDALIIGNGDINALIWSEGGATTLMLTKNDVWDARLLTHNDPPLPTLKRVKELGAKGGVVGASGHYGFIFPEGYKWTGTDSYHAKPYPCPILCGKLLLTSQTTSWQRIRAQGTQHTMKERNGPMVFSLEGHASASSGYSYGPVGLSTDNYSTLNIKLSGSENARFFIDVMTSDPRVIFNTGWQETPTEAKEYKYTLPKGEKIDRLIIYTWTEDGKNAENRIDHLRLTGAAGTKEVKFSEASVASGLLDIEKAVAKVGVDANGAPVTTIRALADRNVFLIRTTDNARLVPSNSLDVPTTKEVVKEDVRYLHKTIPGDLDWKGMEFAVAVAEKGELKAVAIVTSFESKDVVSKAIELAKETLREEESTLIATHEKAWETFWARSGISINDDFFQRTWYRGLYFLRCISKPGVQCPGLFASLVSNTPAWHGDYHTNYNLQQIFWAAYAANQLDLVEPYDRLVKEYLPRGRWLAKNIYNMNGAYYPHVMYAYEPTNPETCKSVNGRQYIHHVWGMTIGVSGFTVQPVWWHYKYAPDRKFLEETAYPVVSEVATFYVNFIEQCEGNGTIKLGPSVSPEHHGWTPNLDLNYNCPFDIAMARFTMEAAIEGATTLGRDEEFVKRCRIALKRLPEYPTYGEKDPIIVDVEGVGPITYNISVPATPVFPGDVVSIQSSKDERDLFERTINTLRWNGNNAVIMMAVSRARLSMDGTFDWTKEQLHSRTKPNGTIGLNRLGSGINNHGHYTEMFGSGIAISELLIQSVNDIIRLFPAWPKDKDASFTSLRTQGGFLVSAEQKNARLTSLKITSTVGGKLQLLSPWKILKANGKVLTPNKQGIVTLETSKGEEFVFER